MKIELDSAIYVYSCCFGQPRIVETLKNDKISWRLLFFGEFFPYLLTPFCWGNWVSHFFLVEKLLVGEIVKNLPDLHLKSSFNKKRSGTSILSLDRCAKKLDRENSWKNFDKYFGWDTISKDESNPGYLLPFLAVTENNASNASNQ